MSGPSPEGELPEELQEEQIVDLPAREALSIVDPGAFGLGYSLPIGRPEPPATTPDSAEPTPPTP
jgi:hypothetical protein